MTLKEPRDVVCEAYDLPDDHPDRVSRKTEIVDCLIRVSFYDSTYVLRFKTAYPKLQL